MSHNTLINEKMNQIDEKIKYFCKWFIAAILVLFLIGGIIMKIVVEGFMATINSMLLMGIVFVLILVLLAVILTTMYIIYFVYRKIMTMILNRKYYTDIGTSQITDEESFYTDERVLELAQDLDDHKYVEDIELIENN